MTASAAAPRQLPIRWLGWASLALLLLIFVIQLPFFFARPNIVWSLAAHLIWIAAWLLAVTAFTRTVRLRMLAAFWFVGVYPVIGLMLLTGRPIAEAFGVGNALIAGFVLPLLEELIKHLPVLLLFLYVARRNRWQLSASDGLLLGFMVGAGIAFHEDVMFGRISGSGWGATPFSWLFPTVYYFRGEMSAYQDVWVALVGLAIGAAFMLRTRTRLAWAIPAVAWLIVFTDHWTWNYLIYASAGDPLFSIATAGRALVLDGALPLIALIVGIIAVVAGELWILRSMARRDRLFPPVTLAQFVDALRAAPQGGWRRLQALREYERARRSAHYTFWVWRPVGADASVAAAMGNTLLALATEAAIQPPVVRAPEESDTRASGEPEPDMASPIEPRT